MVYDYFINVYDDENVEVNYGQGNVEHYKVKGSHLLRWCHSHQSYQSIDEVMPGTPCRHAVEGWLSVTRKGRELPEYRVISFSGPPCAFREDSYLGLQRVVILDSGTYDEMLERIEKAKAFWVESQDGRTEITSKPGSVNIRTNIGTTKETNIWYRIIRE